MPELDEYRISELDPIATLNNNDLIEVSHQSSSSESGYVSGKAPLTQVADKVVNNIQYVTELQTESKTIVGAINEIAQGGGGTTDYDDLENKPQINSVELSGNKSLDDLGIQPSEISKSASGSIATFTDGGDNTPVKSFECEIVAQQAIGTPTPVSPLSIIGFSQADISAFDLNIFDEQMESGTLNNSTGETATDNNKMRSVNFIPVKPNTTYSIYNNTGVNLYIYSYKADKSFIAFDNTGMVTGSTFTTDSNTYYIKFRTQNNPSYNNNISINYPSTDTQYHAYNGNLYTVAFGQTIYGGRLVYSNGQWAIEATHEILTLDGTENVSIVGSGTQRRFNCGNYPIYSSILSSSHFIESVSNSNPWGYYRFVSSTLLLMDNNTQMADETALKTWLANQYSGGTPAQFLCELATPVIIPITSSTRVKTISGANNIFSNTGDCELEYFTEKADSLVELIEAEIDGERQEHNVVKSYTAQLTSSQYGWFTFVDENGNDLLVTNGVPLSASAIADSKYYSGLFVQQPSGKIFFKVVDTNNSSASSFAPIGTSLSNITFNLSYLKF